MAFEQRWIDRYKAQGFYKHVEWERSRGILIRLHEPVDGITMVEFESGTHDHEYDQKIGSYRQFYKSRREAVQMMLNLGFNLAKIAAIFRRVDGMQIVKEFIK